MIGPATDWAATTGTVTLATTVGERGDPCNAAYTEATLTLDANGAFVGTTPFMSGLINTMGEKFIDVASAQTCVVTDDMGCPVVSVAMATATSVRVVTSDGAGVATPFPVCGKLTITITGTGANAGKKVKLRFYLHPAGGRA